MLFDAETLKFTFKGEELFFSRLSKGEVEFPLDVIADVDLRSWIDGMGQFAEACGYPIGKRELTSEGDNVPSDAADAFVYADNSQHKPYYVGNSLLIFTLTDSGRLTLSFIVCGVFELTQKQAEALVANAATAHNMRLTSIFHENQDGREVWSVTVYCDLDIDRTIAALMRACGKLAATLRFPPLDFPTPELIVQLLREGAPEALLGRKENSWFEVKGRPYHLRERGTRARFELARDVARFANSKGGVLLLGIETRSDVSGGDLLHKITPCESDPKRTKSYLETIDQRVHPPINQLTIEEFEAEEGYIVCICVPQQPEEFLPFLVHGALIDDKVEDSFISIPQRRGEGSIAKTGREIHTMIAAGRALLRQQNQTSE